MNKSQFRLSLIIILSVFLSIFLSYYIVNNMYYYKFDNKRLYRINLITGSISQNYQGEWHNF